MSPVSLTSVGVGAGGWIDEVPAVFNIMVDIAVVSEVNVRFPTVGDDRCTRGDILFDDWKKGRLRTGVIRAYHQEATIRTPLNTTKYPAPFNAATTMILALAKPTCWKTPQAYTLLRKRHPVQGEVLLCRGRIASTCCPRGPQGG